MSYSVLSKYYDELVRFDYSGYLAFIEKYLPRGRGLDLACGSGKLTAMLSAKGLAMTGVDNSDEMLSLAAERARRARANVLYLSQDINGIKITKKYDFVISSCDGLNYVDSSDNLKKLFAEVYGALNDGGIFIFDMSTVAKAESVLDGATFYEDTDDYTLLWTNALEGSIISTDITLFERRGNVYNRSDETFEQYFYKNEEVISYIIETGFTAEAFDGTRYEPLSNISERLLVVAKK